MRIVFFSQQPAVVAQCQQALEYSPRLLVPSEQHIGVHEPEAAREESALPGRQAVDRGPGVIAHHESLAKELAFDCGDRALDAGIVWRQKADDGDEQEARVQRRIAERLDERVFLRIIPARAHLLMNRVADSAPTLERSLEPEFLDGSNRAVERDPSHDLRVREVAPPAAHFPDTFVRLPPDILEV